jgi:hypothetical protein
MKEHRKGIERHFIKAFGGRMKSQILLLLIVLVAACAPQVDPTNEPGAVPPDTAVTSPPLDNMPTNEPKISPLAPKPGDDKLSRGNVFVNEKSLLIRESYPPQISLSLKGELPTPCHELRAEIASPDLENKIMVSVYSLVDPNVACAQVIEPFEEFIDLGTFPSGHYSVWVNGELAGEFDS